MTTEQRKYVSFETGTQNKEERLQRKKKRIANPCHGWKQGIIRYYSSQELVLGFVSRSKLQSPYF